MLRSLTIGAVLLAIAGVCGSAAALSISPNPSDLYDLDHNYYYTWGINIAGSSQYNIISASLFIDNIYDWTAEPNDILYVHLLDNPAYNPLRQPGNLPSSKVTTGWDNEGGGDAFSGTPLFTYTDTNGGYPTEDILYTFTTADLVTLNQYWKNNGPVNGVFGLGFDPDCHYYNCGIRFCYRLGAVPEPASLVLLGLGVAGVALRRRFWA